MCASSLIFRAIKWCFSLASGAPPPNPPPRGFAPLDPPQGALALESAVKV